MSRLKTRVPGRYERPAEFRPELGDRAGELGVRAGYREGVRTRARNASAERRAADLARQLIDSGQVTVVDEDSDTPPHTHVPAPTHAEVLDRHRRFVATVESAGLAAVARRGALPLRETAGGQITEAPKDTASGRLVTIDIIRSGWNASGSRYYGADVLERDVPTVYGKGTQMYIDHPSATEGDDRPERSLQTLAGVFADTPWAVHEADGVVVMRTTARVFGPWQPLIREAWDTIGVSINGNGRGDYGTAEGREGLIIDQLTYGRSVDFVTVPGAGGRVLGLLESDRPAPVDLVTREAGSLGAYVESRIHLGFTELGDDLYAGGYVTRQERITLSGAIGDALSVFVGRLEVDAPQLYRRGRYDEPGDGYDDRDTVTAEAAERRTREATAEQHRAAIGQALTGAYGGRGGYCWVEDYDPDFGVVWFTACDPPPSGDEQIGHGPAKTFQQSYLTNNGAVHLVGARVEVRARTVYEPVQVPAAPTYEADPQRYATYEADPQRYARGGRIDPGGRGTAVATTETTAGGPPAASNAGPTAPETTTKESDMGDTKSPEVVAREAAEVRATTAELELARYRAADAAGPVIGALLAEAGDLAELTKTRVREAFPAAVLPLTDTNGLDEAKLRESVTAVIGKEKDYAAQLLEAAGAGTVRGNGAAAGAGAGAPAGIFGGTRTTESVGAVDDGTREALIKQFTANGAMTREAAEAAVDGR